MKVIKIIQSRLTDSSKLASNPFGRESASFKAPFCFRIRTETDYDFGCYLFRLFDDTVCLISVVHPMNFRLHFERVHGRQLKTTTVIRANQCTFMYIHIFVFMMQATSRSRSSLRWKFDFSCRTDRLVLPGGRCHYYCAAANYSRL